MSRKVPPKRGSFVFWDIRNLGLVVNRRRRVLLHAGNAILHQ